MGPKLLLAIFDSLLALFSGIFGVLSGFLLQICKVLNTVIRMTVLAVFLDRTLSVLIGQRKQRSFAKRAGPCLLVLRQFMRNFKDSYLVP
jgi:hypothetical protein